MVTKAVEEFSLQTLSHVCSHVGEAYDDDLRLAVVVVACAILCAIKWNMSC